MSLLSGTRWLCAVMIVHGSSRPGPNRSRDPERAINLARRAIELAPDDMMHINTLGVALYRNGRFAESIEVLKRSQSAGHGQFDGFDLFFLAMAHHRLWHREEARACFDGGVRWINQQTGLEPEQRKALSIFGAEAEAVLAGPCAVLPAEVFAPSRPGK